LTTHVSHSTHEGRPETPPLEAELVRHIVGSRFADLTPEAVEGARRTLLWSMATALAGAGAPGSDAVLKFVLDHGGREAATVVGTGRRAPASLAAFANGVFAKAHEYEDKFWLDKAGGFAMGFAIAPAVLAAAEEEGGIDGRTVLTAIAVGVDIQARLLSAIRGEISPVWTAWNSTYLFSNYGATIAVGKVLGLSEEHMLDALGLVHAQACGNFQGQMEGVLGIRMQAGFAVRNAMNAVHLARNGISGAHQFLSGRFGFYKLHYPAHEIDRESITRGLGTDFLGARLGFKGYPCGVVAHAVLDAVLALRPRFDLGQLRHVRVFGTPTLGIMAEPRERRLNPHNGIDAQFSLPWVIACALRDGSLRLSHFDDGLVHDTGLVALAHKVSIDMKEGREAVTVEIELADRTILRSDPVEYCRGHPQNPVTTEEMAAVFRDHVPMSPVPLGREKAERALSLLLGIAEVDDVRQVFGQP
jgi:2-methylcitrate dehydratase PrpD